MEGMGDAAERHSDAAIRALYAAHGQALLAYARSRTVDQHDAEEVVQEVLVRAWRYSGSYRADRGSERGWLMGIARNVVTDHSKRRTRRLLGLVPTGPDVDAGDLDPELERTTEIYMLKEALGSLSEAHRNAIVAAYFYGKSPGQVAEETGIAPGTVKSRLYYGLRSLRQILEEQGLLQ